MAIYYKGKVVATSGGDKYNKNLLDNWYVGDPINQLGVDFVRQTEHAVVLGIDRWVVGSGVEMTVLKSDGCIRLKRLATSFDFMGQFLYEDAALLQDRLVTMSALIRGDSVVGIGICNQIPESDRIPICTDDWTLISRTFYFTGSADENVWENEAVISPAGSIGSYIDVKAIKLELGSTQTLAHKEGNTWVLNEIPDKRAELENCKRYSFVLGAGQMYDDDNRPETFNHASYDVSHAGNGTYTATYNIPAWRVDKFGKIPRMIIISIDHVTGEKTGRLCHVGGNDMGTFELNMESTNIDGTIDVDFWGNAILEDFTQNGRNISFTTNRLIKSGPLYVGNCDNGIRVEGDINTGDLIHRKYSNAILLTVESAIIGGNSVKRQTS